MIDLGVAASVAELLQATKAAEAAFNKAQLWFRGHADWSWSLEPSAHRASKILESTLANRFRLEAPSISARCPPHHDTAAWLPLMRHYGLPTRLLDWSESLLVAAFFASESMAKEDRAIWMLSPGALNRAETGNPSGAIPFLTADWVRPSVDAAFGILGQSTTRHLAVYAPRTDPRMAAQLGNYTIHSPHGPLEDHLSADRFLARVVIPAAAVATLRYELSISGVRRASLFPDLENLAKEISALIEIGPDD